MTASLFIAATSHCFAAETGARHILFVDDHEILYRSGTEWPGFHAAFSPDGIRWTKSPKIH